MENFLTEKEKMLAGELYDAFLDKSLAEDRIKAKCLCHKFNALSPDKLSKIFGVTMGIILRLGRIFTQTMTAWCLILQRLRLVIMFLLRRSADFIRQDIR